jgi:hypothetical protein
VAELIAVVMLMASATLISAPDTKRAPVVYDDPGDANGAVARARDGSLPAWAVPLATSR